MTKPNMADGSVCVDGGTILDSSNCIVRIDRDGGLDVDYYGNGAVCDPLDAIRALVEGGQLPLWDAAVRICDIYTRSPDAINVSELLGAVSALCRVVDDMKETTP